MNEEGMVAEEQDYASDFWPGFVDILSGLILIFSFLILVAGVVIAVVYQTYSTIKQPTTKFTHVLAIVQKSPLIVDSQDDIIEKAIQGKSLQVLVQTTKQQLEDIAERTNQVLKNFPLLKRKLIQEIRFLQKEIRLVKVSPPPEGQTQKPRSFKGGRLNRKGADNIAAANKNWEITLQNNTLFIAFANEKSLAPTPDVNRELQNSLRTWVAQNPGLTKVKIAVANATAPYSGIAQKDSLRRALYLRELLRVYNVKTQIIAQENTRKNHPFGWILISPK